VKAFARPEVKARIQRFAEKGGQQKDDLELNLGEHLPGLKAPPGGNQRPPPF
jgi:hypothetical protein